MRVYLIIKKYFFDLRKNKMKNSSSDKINSTKSVFFKESVSYLGYCLSGNGLTPDPLKVEPLVKSPVPCNFDALRSFLGAAQYYSRFISQLSSLAAPLYDLLQKEQFV